jgi:acetyl/propionyl-CoA carboxylase alpha subunit
MSEFFNVRIGSREYSVDIQSDKILVNGQPLKLDGMELDGHCGLRFRADGQAIRAVFDRSPDPFILFHGREFPVEIETERDRLLKRYIGAGGNVHHHAEIRASMPGLIVRLGAQPGTTVTRGQAVLILEAMKMENEIRAPMDGTIREVHVRQGQTVEKNDLLMVLD